MSHKAQFTVLFSVSVLLLLGILALALPVPGYADLPPRTPLTPVPAGNGDKADKQPAGAYIETQVQAAPTDSWGVVQWQDTSGGWHDVESWQGPLNSSGYQHWWVAPKDFGTGPFRWLVATGQGGDLLGSSENFYLPSVVHTTQYVVISLNQ